jgi:hypothetical protein
MCLSRIGVAGRLAAAVLAISVAAALHLYADSLVNTHRRLRELA